MTFAIVALLAALLGWLLPPPWHRRARAKAQRRLGVPLGSDLAAAIEKAKADHRAHALEHPVKYPGHLTERALRARVKQELAARGFKYAPLDLAARLKG